MLFTLYRQNFLQPFAKILSEKVNTQSSEGKINTQNDENVENI